eukprot:1157957-Pelagomonas_calceolata.AAC.18
MPVGSSLGFQIGLICMHCMHVKQSLYNVGRANARTRGEQWLACKSSDQENLDLGLPLTFIRPFCSLPQPQVASCNR